MVYKRRPAYRRGQQKSAKRPALPQVVASSVNVCPRCHYNAFDSYDLSSHLRGNAYCNNHTNVTSIESSSLPRNSVSSDFVLGVASIPADDGDHFMFDDECSDVDHSISLDGDISDDGKLPPPQPKNSVASHGGDLSPGEDSSDDSSTGGYDDSSVISSSLLISDPPPTYAISDGTDNDDDEYEFYDETSFPSGVDDVVHVSLADLCHRIKAPNYAYNHILRWAQHAQSQGYSFPVEAPLYHTFISNLKRRLHVEDFCHKTETVEKVGGGTVSFPVFDFQSMFISLIDDHRIKDNLLVNWDCPSLPPAFNTSELDEIHSGDWYHDTSEMLITPGADEVLCGIILAIDRTHVADKEKLSLEPVLFSLSIIPRSLRNHPYAWRPLGFMPPKPSASKGKGYNAATHHRVLRTMLSGLVRAQSNGGIKCCLINKLDADGVDREFTFKVPLAFVIGDVEGHDLLCGRFKTHNTPMLSRECNCSMDNADNHLVECQYIRPSELTLLRQSNDVATLNKMAFHNLRNAFDDVSFGANEYGIHRATMSEVLHAIQKGWYLYLLSGLYDILSGKPMEFLDDLAMRVSRQCRHQSYRDFPRLTFGNGIRSYKLMHAHETSGLLLLLTLSLYCSIGYDKNHTEKITQNSFARNASCRTQIPRLKEFRKLIQMLLCMEAWMKQNSIQRQLVIRERQDDPQQPDQSQAKAALRIALENYVKVVRRKKGHGLKHVKTHSVLHLSDDILRFGSPNNWNTARVESGHKFHAKYPALRTQRRKDLLEDQVGTLTTNLLALTVAKDLISNSPDTLPHSTPDTSSTNNSHTLKLPKECGSHFLLKVTQSGQSVSHQWFEKGKRKNSKESKTVTSCSRLFDSHVYDRQMRFVADVFLKAIADDDGIVPDFDIHCFTEIKVVEDGESHIYRGHPSYRGEDPWHDWVYVKWKGLDNRFVQVPGEIQFFVKVSDELFPNCANIDGYRGQGTYAVIQSMSKEPTPYLDSLLLLSGTREKETDTNDLVFHLQKVDTFVVPAFVVDNIGCRRKSLFVVRPQSEWPNLFL